MEIVNNKKKTGEIRNDPEKRKGRVNYFLLIGSGILMMIGSFYTFTSVLKGVYGSDYIADNLASGKFITTFFQGEQGPTVGILESQFTQNMLPAGSTWQQDNMATWKRFLALYNINYEVFHDSDIERGSHKKYPLLILPGCKSLSDVQVLEIKRYIDGGGSVFATSGISTFSDNGKWRGWEFLGEVFGMKFIKEVERDEITKVHTMRGGLPITGNVPTGFPLKVATWDRPIAAEVLEPRTTQIGFWFNFRKDEGLVREGIKKSAGMAYGNYGKGRFVWWGFELTSLVGLQEDYIYYDKVLRNSLYWLLYLPIAYVKDWPGNYKAASIIVPVVSETNGNIHPLAQALVSEKIRPLFMMESSRGEENPNFARSLTGYGDLGSTVDIGYLANATDTVNKLNSFETQAEALRSSKDKLKAVSGGKILGVEPLYGFFDDNTVRAASESGYLFVLSDSATDRSVPRSVIKGKNIILSITKTARDDFEVVRNYGLTDPEMQLYTYKEDVDRVLFEGGLHVLKLHPEYQGLPQYVSVIKPLVQYIRQNNIWTPTVQELYDWWTRRNKIEMRIESRSASRLAVTVSNSGGGYLEDFTVSVDLQKPVKGIRISSEIIGTKIPEYNFDPGTRYLHLYLKKFEAGESRIFYIDYDEVKKAS